jgi:hypothetical protein
VFDRVNGIVVFETRDGAMTHLRSFGAEFQPTGACVFGDTLVVPGWRENKILHVFSLADEDQPRTELRLPTSFLHGLDG